MISDRTLQAAILALLPPGADRIDIDFDRRNEFGNPWTVTFAGSGATATAIGALLSDATKKATSVYLMRRDENERALAADRNRAGVALAYSADWTPQPDARVFARAEERN